MPNLLIDGKHGVSHITAQQLADEQMHDYGEGDYVLTTGTQFEYEQVSVNELSLSNGAGIMQGHRWGIDAGTTVSVEIENGAVGQIRSDLIVARYTSNSDGTQSVNIIAIKGANGGADPQANTDTVIRDGASLHDQLLYRVKLDGVNIDSIDTLWELPTTGAIDSTVQAKWETILPSGVTNFISRVLGYLADFVGLPHIIQSGYSGGWYYKKYSNGFYDAVYVATVDSIPITNASGNIYISALRTKPSPMKMDISREGIKTSLLGNDGYYCWIAENTETKYYLCRATAQTPTNVKLCHEVVGGRWK